MKAVQDAVYTALNVAAMLALAPGGVHSPAAPDRTTYPYIRVNWLGGPSAWTLGKQVSDELRFDVVGVTIGLDATPLESIKAKSDELLNGVALVVTGKTCWVCRKTGEIPTYSELGQDGRMRLYSGNSYRAVVA